MRINVHTDELTKEIRIVSESSPETGEVFFGVRWYLRGADSITVDDPEYARSALTFWYPKGDVFSSAELADCLELLARHCRSLPSPLKLE